jgi:menaquinone-dependent protoporphyrinogen IX oxidase
MKTLIAISSRYGASMEIGRWMIERLPWDETTLVPVADAPEPSSYDLIFLGGGVYNEQVEPAIVTYAETQASILKEKKTVAFGVCLDTRGVYMKGRFFGGWLYLEPLLKVLDKQSLLYAGMLSGEINPQKLSTSDRDLLMHFYTKILKRDITEVPFRTLMSKSEVWTFIEKVISRLDGKY